jgi:hypothetical protein
MNSCKRMSVELQFKPLNRCKYKMALKEQILINQSKKKLLKVLTLMNPRKQRLRLTMTQTKKMMKKMVYTLELGQCTL